MKFSEKLSFLMDITKTTNSALSLYVSLDASYISRLRSGKRMAPRSNSSINGMANYFARHCTEDYQKKALGDMIGLNPFPEDPYILSRAIVDWLLQHRDEGSDSIGHFLGGLSAVQVRTVPDTDSEDDFPRKDISIFYGVEGKRKAVLFFLNEVISHEKPQTLLLFSDEDTSWMTGDPRFARKWANAMMKVLSLGHHVKIIHTVSRDLDEMLSALGQWMPLYLAGNIEPYFCPKKRDGIFKNTLFIASGISAVVSGSVGSKSIRSPNLLLRDPAAVKSYEEQFYSFLNLCLPLMRIYKGNDRSAYRMVLAEFEKESCRTLIKAESLSLLTMPEPLFAQIIKRAGLDSNELEPFHRHRVKNFRQVLNSSDFTEIISIPKPQDVLSGQVKVALSDIMELGTVSYTVEEYIEHLGGIVELLHTYENYHVNLVEWNAEEKYLVYVKEDSRVILVKNAPPPAALVMSEANMTAAFWDYLKAVTGEKRFENHDNKLVSQKLCKYIEQLGELV